MGGCGGRERRCKRPVALGRIQTGAHPSLDAHVQVNLQALLCLRGLAYALRDSVAVGLSAIMPLLPQALGASVRTCPSTSALNRPGLPRDVFPFPSLRR